MPGFRPRRAELVVSDETPYAEVHVPLGAEKRYFNVLME
jgi:hypothetical protein